MRNLLAVTSLFTLVLVGAFGIWSTFCIFSNMASICHMDIVEHIAYWQGLFLAIIFIFYFAAVFVFFGAPKLEADFLEGKPSPNLYLDIFLSNYLKRAFSQGIIHPKIF